MRARIDCFLLILFAFPIAASAQNDVMLQGFYWDVPVDDANKDGSWWDTLASQAPELKQAGFTGIWTPSPCKGNFGIWDMGYGIFDHYDLGNYDQKGTVETRFGSRSELLGMVSAMHANGIEVYADIVLNHVYASDDQSEANPAVKQYVFDEARRFGTQFTPYPTNEITWRIPNADAGDYYIKIKGYALDPAASYVEHGYDLMIRWDETPEDRTTRNWESEPNNGQGQYTSVPGSGKHWWAHINSAGDIDEYKVTVAAPNDLTIRLEARREVDGELVGTSQTNGYYPYEIWHDGQNLAPSTLQARTNTNLRYVPHTGPGESNHAWSYSDFHPADNNDWLGGPGGDELITNSKLFGNDLNTFSPTVQDRFQTWGVWLSDTVGYDGYRLDFVRGFQESYAAAWIKALPKNNGHQPFVVGEYWGSAERIEGWVNALASQGADADGFDFPLKQSLTSMANGDESWDMRWLNHAGLVRNDEGHGLPGTSVVTFVENHDTGKEHDKWLRKDWGMAYAYILFAEGRPCLFYSHFYGVPQQDAHDTAHTVSSPASLQDDLKRLIDVRKTYLGGTLSVLSEVGHPWPEDGTRNVFVARRQGNAVKSGGILVINNDGSESKGLWVDHAPIQDSRVGTTRRLSTSSIPAARHRSLPTAGSI